MSGDGEEDWFERALEDEPDDADAAAVGDDSEAATAAEPETADPSDGAAFEEDFATAFEGAPEAPAGEFDAPAEADWFDAEGETAAFDEEPFDSSIPRIDFGIEGLDNMIQGGLPERSLIVAIGDAGTGKTTMGLQFIHHALEHGENTVFITLEESYDRVISTADDKGWDFSSYVEADQLAVIDLDPVEMSNSLTSIRTELPDLVREFDASRLVLDSVSLLEMMFDDQATRRTQIYDFTQSLKAAGVSTMFTSEASEEDPYHSRFGIIEYLTDAVFILRYIRSEDFREIRLAVEIQKIRDANHSREMKPYEITNEGISVYRQANLF